MGCSTLGNIVVVQLCIHIFIKTAAPAILTNPCIIDNQEDDCEDETLFNPFRSRPRPSDAYLVRVGTCDEKFTLVEIRRKNKGPPYVTICHDETRDSTLWVKHYINGRLLRSPQSPERSKCFTKDIFYIRSPRISPQNSYT
ncbi:unnamed protein product [Orchesella dallaii]|uniref:Secreted protein n=1 Tax=Orchesella dallaii TaxID=48710 RepID=A0ABP1R0X5_9HEXA